MLRCVSVSLIVILSLVGSTCYAHTVSGTVVDSFGGALSEMKIELASGEAGSDPLFTEATLKAETDKQGHFALSTDWEGRVSFHITAYSNEYYGEVCEWHYVKNETKKRTDVCIVCGKRYTLSIQPVYPKGISTKDNRMLVVLMPNTARSRVHIVKRSEAGRISFPVGFAALDVLCLADPINKDIPQRFEVSTRGWMLRGEAQSAKCGEVIKVSLNDFRVERSAKGGMAPLMLRIPNRNSPCHVIGVDDAGQAVWFEAAEGFWNAHVSAGSEFADDGHTTLRTLTIHSGSASKIVLWDKVEDDECVIKVKEMTCGKWMDVDWVPVDEKRFTVRLPPSESTKKQQNTLSTYPRCGAYWTYEEMRVNDRNEFSFSMPSVFTEVNIKIHTALPKGEDPVWDVRVVAGVVTELPQIETREYKLKLKGPSNETMALSLFKLRTTSGKFFRVQLGADSTGAVYLVPEKQYEILIGDRWVKFAAPKSADVYELKPWSK